MAYSRFPASVTATKTRPGRAQRLLQRALLENLESRMLLSLAFAPQFPGQTTTNGGTVDTGNVPMYLIFAGNTTTGFGKDGSLTSNDIITAVNKILASPFLTGLSEYGATSSVFLNGTYVSNYALPTSFSSSDLQNCVEDALNDGNGTLPEVDDTSVDGIYFVVTPQGYTSSDNPNFVGYHTYGSTGGFLDPDNTAFGWVGSAGVFDNNRGINLSPIDSQSALFSHELAETISDPDTQNGVTTLPPSNAPYFQSPGEVCDDEAQYYHGYEGDVCVQSIWSAAQGKFIIPGATAQSFPQSGTSLKINGDQLGPTPQNDSLTISDNGGGLTITLNSDTVNYGPGAVTHIDVKLGTGTNTVTINSLPAGVTISIDGSGGVTTITANTGPNNWHINGANSGDLNGVVTFTGVSGLTGGSGVDNFDFSGSGSIGSIDGAGGSNTLDESGVSGPVTVGLNSSTATHIGGTFANIGNFVGSPASDSLRGLNSAATWNISGANAGSVSGVTFSSFENLVGGSGADTFKLAAAGSVSGTISGGFGTDTLDYSAWAGPITVDLNLGTAPGIGGGFTGIDNVVGSASANDTIIGPDASWIINGANAGSVNGITFSSFENLTGNALTDTFAFQPGGSISGNLDGGSGNNTLDYSALAGPITVNLQTHTAPGIGGTFVNINNLVGSGGSDTLVGPDANTTWNLTGANSGDVNGATTFSSFENLVGGSGDDAFVFFPGGGVSGNVNGGGGNNTLDYHNLSTPVSIGLGTNTATGIGGTWSNINTFIGGSGANIIVGPDTPTTYTITGHNLIKVLGFTFGGFQSVTGGAGGDTFAFLTGGSLDGNIDGGGGTNTVTYAGYVGDVVVNFVLQTATGVGGTITHVQNATGGVGNSMLVGDANANVLTGGTGRNVLIGGAGGDTLVGGGSDNILIGDSTIFDSNATALAAIFAEWTRTDKSFEQRVADLISVGNNGLNGVYTLDKQAIVLDNAVDLLQGSTGTLDWFFADKKLDTDVGTSPQDHTTLV